MPLELIPNQPFIFEQPIGDYPCLNNDEKAYAQLVQDGDVTCVQWKLDACDEPLCEPDMVQDPLGTDELGAWTVGGGWSTVSSAEIAFDGTGNPGGLCNQTVAGLTTGTAYILELDATTYTGLVTYEVIIDLQTVYIIDRAGQHNIGFTAPSASFDVAFNPLGTSTAGDQLVVESMTLKQHTTCWVDDLNGGLSSWTYAFDGANGKFCSLDPSGGDLINTTAFTTTGNYHGVELTISNCTTGGVEVYIGSVLVGTTSGNGTFRFYGIPTAGTDLVFTKVDSFDGCISQVTVFDYGDVSTAAVTVRSNDNFYKADALTPTPFEDRLIQCIDWETLSWNMNGTPTDCIPLRVDIKDPCDNNVLYISVNRALYRSGGAEWECTKMVESWNDGFAFGFYFGDIAAPDFVLRQRLRVLAFNPVYRNAGEEYLYSSGNTGRSFAQSQKARTAWFDYMDEYAHDCTRTQLLGQKLLIDNYAFYYPTEDYEPEWNERGAYNLAQSRVTVFHEEAIFGSTCGTMANAVCPPQIVNVPVPVPAPYTQVNFLQLDPAPTLDWTSIYMTTRSIDKDGNVGTVTAYGPYDVTNVLDRVQLYNDLTADIDIVFSTTSSGSVTLTTSLIINITGSISLSSPQPVLAVAFSDTINQVIPLATTLE